MENYYSLLGIDKNATPQEIKKAFREKAKQLHPDIAGKAGETAMRRLLAAYQALSSPNSRFAYDRVSNRFSRSFDYPSFLKNRKTDPVSQAKLVFFLLLNPHYEQFDPLEVWTENGGLGFAMEKYLDREDWMDCAFLLAEELDRQERQQEAFSLLVRIAREEKLRPYFKHFMEDVEIFLRSVEKTLARRKRCSAKRSEPAQQSGARQRSSKRQKASAL